MQVNPPRPIPARLCQPSKARHSSFTPQPRMLGQSHSQGLSPAGGGQAVSTGRGWNVDLPAGLLSSYTDFANRGTI